MFLKELEIEGFKGVNHQKITFSANTLIEGVNGCGKSTIMDAFFWLVSGCNSKGESDQKFDVRPLDENGEKVHYSVISVKGIIDLDDGATVELEKQQAEKWTKKRGQEEQVYSGNVNTYKINGYPKSQNEYKAFVSSIIDEKMLRILSSPAIFPELDWKEQRKILLSMITISPDEIGKDVKYYDTIASELKMETPDAIKKKYTQEKNNLKKEQERIPTEINTLNQQIAELDVNDLDSREMQKKEELETVRKAIFELQAINNDSVNAQIIDCQTKQKHLVSAKNDKRTADIASAHNACRSLSQEIEREQFSYNQINGNLKRYMNQKMTLEKEIEVKRATYKGLKEATFPDKDTYCDKCGQKLPENKIAELKQVWEQRKADRLQDYTEDGKRLASEIEKVDAKIEAERNSLAKSKEYIEKLESNLEEEKARYEQANAIPVSDGTDIPEFCALNDEIEKLKVQLTDLTENNRKIEEFESRKVEIETDLNHINDIRAQARLNEKIKCDIDARTARLKEVSRMVGECDLKLFAVEGYVKALSKMINSKFQGLTFKLFENQVNGGVKETCEISYDGVPYTSLNTGHRIIVGCEIIKVMQKHFGIKVPVWIDNAECLSNGNIPEFDGQRIILKVSDKEILTVSN